MPKPSNNNEKWIGQKFGRLTVRGFENRNGVWYWNCVCDCGNERTVHPKLLKRGSTISCGCWGKEKCRETLYKGRDKHWNLYRKWSGIKTRCTNEKSDCYKNYGARGIKLCDEWQDYEPFERWALENGYDPNLTIDRIDNNGPYSPDNCRWTDRKTQCRNRRSNVRGTILGEEMTLIEACEMMGTDYSLAHSRISRGMSFEQAFGLPKMKNGYC